MPFTALGPSSLASILRVQKKFSTAKVIPKVCQVNQNHKTKQKNQGI